VYFPKQAKNGIIAAAMGIFFSVDKYDKSVTDAERAIINEFFDSLKWGATGDQTSPKVTYGNLMMMVNMRERWSYKGSVTTPPCLTTVYWNVVRQIYPIKQAHLDQFKQQMQRGVGADKAFDASNPTNYRLIQERGNRKIYHIVDIKDGRLPFMNPTSDNSEQTSILTELLNRGTGTAGVVILFIILLAFLVGCGICLKTGKLEFVPSTDSAPKKPAGEFDDPKGIKTDQNATEMKDKPQE